MNLIFTLKQFVHNIEQDLSQNIIFIDFKQAYNKGKRGKVFKLIKDIGIHNKLTKIVKMTLTDTEYKVNNGRTSHNFSVRKDLKQSNPLSTILFNMVLDIT